MMARMGCVYPRKERLWLKFKLDGKWAYRKTKWIIGEEAHARALLEQIEGAIKSGAEIPPDAGTVAAYAAQWIKNRSGRVKSWKDEQGWLDNHILPKFGERTIVEVRMHAVLDFVRELRTKEGRRGTLAPKTVRNIHGVFHALMEDARIHELIPGNPCDLPRGSLPKKVDKDPTWRRKAVFTREELEQLIADPKILEDRRVLYALKGLAALRHSEAARLRWDQYDADAKPLGCISLHKTKTDTPREMPVHPALAKVLEEWREQGWKRVYGRAPLPDDLIVPTRRMRARAPAEAQVRFLHDLGRIGLRARRGHDLRRTFISLARTDGANREILRAVTHGARGDIYDLYTTWDWPTLCAEVAKLKVRARRVTSRVTRRPGPHLTRRQHYGNLATPTGFENVRRARKRRADRRLFSPLHGRQWARGSAITAIRA